MKAVGSSWEVFVYLRNGYGIRGDRGRWFGSKDAREGNALVADPAPIASRWRTSTLWGKRRRMAGNR